MISQKKFWLIIIFILAVAVRALYYAHAVGIYVSDDTYAYYQIGQKMFSEKSFVDDLRTPAYPVILNLPLYLSNSLNSPMFSAPFILAMDKIILLQSIIGVATLVIFYFTLVKIKISPFYALVFLLFIGIDPMIFAWERLLLPESLTVFFLVALSYTAIQMLKKPSFFFFFTFLLLLVFGFFLRPIYILLPLPVLLIIIVYHHFKRPIIFAAIFTFIMYFTLIAIYIKSNSIRNGYLGISRASDINLLGKILQFNLPIESGKNEAVVYDAVSQYRLTNRQLHPWRLLDSYGTTFYGNTSNLNSLSRFTKTVVLHNFGIFLWRSIGELPASLLGVSEKYILKPPATDILSFFFNSLFRLYHNLQYFTLIAFIAYPYSAYQFLKTKTFHHAAMFLIANIALYQIAFVVFFSYAEYGRLISPVQPLLYLFSFYWWGEILSTLFARIQKPNPAKRKMKG